MAEYLIQDTTLTAIAESIREKTGETGALTPTQMATKIEDMQLGSDVSGVTATAGDVLSPKIFVNNSGEEVTGTIATKTSSNLTASGATVSVPVGYYASAASKSVATATQATPSITVSSAGLITASATQTAGYVSAGTKSGTKQLTVQAAQTITPSTSNKTIASGRYLTGTQTIKGDANLVAANIKKGVSIFGVAGSCTGSSGALSAATILVTYPAGSTCTVTSGSTTYTALNTSGSAAFSVPAGTWTVKAVSGSNTVSKSVTVAASAGVSVELYFTLTIYNGTWLSGYGFIPLTSSWTGGESLVNTYNSANPPYITWTNGHGGYIGSVDVTNYKTLTVTYELTGYVEWFYFGLSTDTNWYNNAATNMPVYSKRTTVTAQRETITFDTSALTGNYVFKLYAWTSTATFKLYNMQFQI